MKNPSVTELKQEAKALGIKGYYKLKKKELIETLEKYYSLENNFIKKFYKIKLTSNNGTLEIPLPQVNGFREAMVKFKKTKSSNLSHSYPQLELFEDNKLIRRERR